MAREAAPISVDAAGEDEVIAGIRTGLEPATSGADSIEPGALRGINEKRVNPKLTHSMLPSRPSTARPGDFPTWRRPQAQRKLEDMCNNEPIAVLGSTERRLFGGLDPNWPGSHLFETSLNVSR